MKVCAVMGKVHPSISNHTSKINNRVDICISITKMVVLSLKSSIKTIKLSNTRKAHLAIEKTPYMRISDRMKTQETKI